MSTKTEQQTIVRNFCNKAKSQPMNWTITQSQTTSQKDRPARGGVWISRTKINAPPEPDLRDALYEVIDGLKRLEHDIPFRDSLETADVKVEFLGARGRVAKDAPEPKIPELEKLKALEEECQSDMTILYVHGGGIYTGSPQEARPITVKLAKLTKARVCSTSYRLSPQSPFPAPILDVLVTYASLIYPPPGSAHKAVPASKIVLSGDSAGAMLVFALTKFLLEHRKLHSEPSISFNGRTVSLPLPAGIVTTSGWCDPCDSLPSWHVNGAYDFLTMLQPACMPGFTADSIWPTNPPRETPYCRAGTLSHELVCAAAVKDWTGAPPMWFAMGCEELGFDGNRVVASQAAKSGVSVQWNEYEGMCHEFMMVMAKLPQSGHAFESMAAACLAFAAGKGPVESKGLRWLMPSCEEASAGKVEDLAPLPHDEILSKMKYYNATRPVWTGTLHIPKL